MTFEHQTPRGILHTGLLPRVFGHVVSIGAVRACRAIPMPPLPVVLTQAHSPDIAHMFLNDQFGCCSCAGMANAMEIVTADARGAQAPISDADVLQTYELVCPGFSPGPPVVNDNGAVLQRVLQWWQTIGFPLEDGTRLKAGPVFELNPRNLAGICEAIMEFGFVYIGFGVPEGFMEQGPLNLWVDDPTFGDINGGHCVLLHGFDRTDPNNIVFNVTTWGTNAEFKMRQDFLLKYVDEIYAVFLQPWVEHTGKTPYGLDVTQLEALGGEVGTDLTASVEEDRGATAAAQHGLVRSSHWPTVRKAHLEQQPVCQATGLTEHQGAQLEVHHMFPFHFAVLLGRQSRELAPSNLITLARHPIDVHLLLGHDDNFEESDRNPIEAAKLWYGRTDAEIRGDEEWLVRKQSAYKRWAEWSNDEKIAERKKLDTMHPIGDDEYNAINSEYGVTDTPFDEWIKTLD